MQIKHRFTSSYHPQSNALAERMLRFFGEELSAYIIKAQDNWLNYAPYFAFAYNTTNHSITGYKPYYLPFGVEPNLTIDALFGNIDSPQIKSEKTLAEYFEALRYK